MINSNKAKEIVRIFLEQNHVVRHIKEPILEGRTWIVEANVTSFVVNHIKRVEVDAETGRVIGYK